jgi:hypothetical protein
MILRYSRPRARPAGHQGPRPRVPQDHLRAGIRRPVPAPAPAVARVGPEAVPGCAGVGRRGVGALRAARAPVPGARVRLRRAGSGVRAGRSEALRDELLAWYRHPRPRRAPVIGFCEQRDRSRGRVLRRFRLAVATSRTSATRQLDRAILIEKGRAGRDSTKPITHPLRSPYLDGQSCPRPRWEGRPTTRTRVSLTRRGRRKPPPPSPEPLTFVNAAAEDGASSPAPRRAASRRR